MLEKATTSAITMPLMASTSFVLSRKRGRISNTQSSASGTQVEGLSSVAICGGADGRSILFQFVVQSFQADAQNLCGAGLIVIRGFQRFQNQQSFGLAYRGAYSDPHGIRIAYRRMYSY